MARTLKERLRWWWEQATHEEPLWLCWLMRPYLEWRWRRDRSVVCIEAWCYRMCAPGALRCVKHAWRLR